MALQHLELPDVWIPVGYGTTYLHIREARARIAPQMHPAFDRRLWPAIASTVEADGRTRVGSGSMGPRPNPDPVSYASRMGWSFHQLQRFASGLDVFASIDAVARDGSDSNFNHDAVTHDDAVKIERFGLHANVGTYGKSGYEAWHWQCLEMDGYQTWVSAGRPDPSMTWKVPGVTPPPVDVDYGLYPVNDSKPRLTVGSEGLFVSYAQRVMNDKAGQHLTVDGQFGPNTAQSVNNVRAVFGLPIRGVLDWDGSWEAIDYLAGWDWSKTDPNQPPPEPPLVDVEAVNEVWYYVQPGDGPWRAAERLTGNGANWGNLGLRYDHFGKANYYIKGLRGYGKIATVRPDDGPLKLIKRMFPTENQYGLLSRYYDLNGGEGRTIHPGELVFLNLR